MTTLLIIDLETTGTDPDGDSIVEVGAVLFDCATAVPVACKSALVRAAANPAALVNGIPEAALAGPWCIAPEHVRPTLAGLAKLAPEPPILVAHNAAFERGFLPDFGERWICTWEDAVWPRVPGETGSLVNIALAYGVGIARAHRAIEDCLTLAAILGRVHEIEGGLDAWLFRATEPKAELIGCQRFEENQLAKDAGFRWDSDRKLWVRRIGESRVGAFVEALPFRVRQGSEAA
jgi:DNA polymerase-3 subunit epsilon